MGSEFIFVLLREDVSVLLSRDPAVFVGIGFIHKVAVYVNQDLPGQTKTDRLVLHHFNLFKKLKYIALILLYT